MDARDYILSIFYTYIKMFKCLFTQCNKPKKIVTISPSPSAVIHYTKEHLQEDIEKSVRHKIKQNKISAELNIYKNYNEHHTNRIH